MKTEGSFYKKGVPVCGLDLAVDWVATWHSGVGVVFHVAWASADVGADEAVWIKSIGPGGPVMIQQVGYNPDRPKPIGWHGEPYAAAQGCRRAGHGRR